MKPFKTFRQQLKILRDRGLLIPDGSKAMRVLEREGYYALINGYKDLFLELDSNDKPLIPDQYKVGSTFDEICQLYSFDRSVRNLILEYILIFESSIKAKVSYRFSEKYKEPHAYLVMKNYSRDPAHLKDVLSLISTISSTISKKGNSKNNPVKHYLDNHDGVPLWVLVNYLTIGNMNYFYKCLTNSLQNTIAQDFAINYNRDYQSTEHITPEMIMNVLKISNFFRNVCAHEERLYSYKVQNPPKNRQFSSVLNIPAEHLRDGKLFTLVSFLKIVLPKNEHKQLVIELNKLINDYQGKFVSVSFNDILENMGFPRNWRTYFQ
ncbi:Abi family protein [Exiguobacterium aestuarii]|uniref:Abi family protein n=1 Tax=Exiguobacterium aestuarii TaxID=273527 RepID=A0ABW2PIQ7_9BACL|nr:MULTISPECIES: Abi family protein [Exiguobacterium]MCT4785710.1 Abi family protein [Exiguobacterium aestuarii]